jgi:MOSC domain-containing protein YiiM
MVSTRIVHCLSVYGVLWIHSTLTHAYALQCVNPHKVRWCTVLSATCTVADPVGTVVRVAAKAYHPQNSKPSSRAYTTRKEARDRVLVQTQGVSNDYNHYRTLALANTTDRAVSILTMDVMDVTRSTYTKAQDGDLGENLLIQGVNYTFFELGQVYEFASNTNETPSVMVQITEPMEPCGNLCTLPYINDANKAPKDRIASCTGLLKLLGQHPGMRGWYAKVIQEGVITQGYRVKKCHNQKCNA